MSFIPLVCPPSSGTGGGADVENLLLCDIDADGEILGTALAVYEYDSDGNPVGPPTFVDPATGDEYVPQGTLQPCPGEVGCLAPVQFCFTSTSTGPVDHPGRQYDITLPINPGFPVQSLQVDAINHAANIVWDVADPDGEQFRQDLTAFIEARIPADAVVTITNPNAGNVICGTAQPMQIHIECLRLDQNPPNLIELVYNGGEDLILNPAYNETPPLNPPVSQGNYGFHLLSRQDDPGPFPINQPANDANCTNVANRGWETNDIGRTFEIWGQDQVLGQGVTPTPRGTPVQEMTSDGAPPGGRSTIWQTFMAPASANFIVRVVHGARDPGENHIIALDFGDTDDAQNGDLINDNTNPPGVTSASGSNPWTTFSQTLPLTAGQVYTLSLSSTNPVAGNRGGLFTDMRAYIDRPDLRATATTDDDTCVVTVDETTTNTDCQLWQPRCINGEIVSWRNVETQAELANAAFWGQAPAPDCCLPQAAEGEDGGSVAANLVHNYEICGIVGGVPTTLNRIVITDASGGVLLEQIVGADGAPVAPSSYTIGKCDSSNRYVNDEVLCDANGPFLRKYVQNFNGNGQIQVQAFRDFTLDGVAYEPFGEVGACATDRLVRHVTLCDDNGPFNRTIILDPEGNPEGAFDTLLIDGSPYSTVGVVGPCPQFDVEEEILCDDNGPFIRRFVFDVDTGAVTSTNDVTLAGAAYVPVGTIEVCPVEVSVQPAEFEFEEEVLCDDNGPFFRRTTFNTQTQTYGPVADFTLAGAPYVTVGTVTTCNQPTPQIDVEEITVCITVGGVDRPGIRRVTYTDGVQTAEVFLDLNGVVVVPAAWRAGDCQRDVETQVLCDDNGPFIVNYSYVDGTLVLTNFTTIAGTAYAPVGPIVSCSGDTFAVEHECFQDSNGRFYRAYVFTDTTGDPTTTFDFNPDGTPHVAAGIAVTCDSAIGIDTEEEILCDSNGTQFIRRYAWSAANGFIAPLNVDDWELDGITPFVPVGAVALCSDTTSTPVVSVDSTIQRQTGAGSIVIAAGARSVTLAIIAGTVTINLGQGVITVPAGTTLTWSVDNDNTGETLSDAFTFTGIAGSDFIVTSTRQL